MRIENRDTGAVIESTALERRLGRLRRRFNAWGEVIDKWDRGKVRMMQIRLSYPVDGSWEANDIREFMRRLRVSVGKDLLAYAWVVERTETAGALHYHVYVVLRRGHDNLPFPDQSGLWVHGSSNVRRVDNEVGSWRYLVSSYGGKQRQKSGPFPRGMRMFCCWIREGLVSGAEEVEYRLSVLPVWLADRVRERWLVERSGEWVRALWPYRDEFGEWWVGNLRVRSPWRLVSALDYG